MGETFPADTLILIVDDMPATRSMLKEMLSGLGYSRFLEAQNGNAALELLRRGERPGLILSDWNMPEMNGLELLRSVRQNPALAGTPLVLVTSEGEVKYELEAIASGVSQYLVKPFTMQSLTAKLEAAWNRARPLARMTAPASGGASGATEDFEPALAASLAETLAAAARIAVAQGERFLRGQGALLEAKVAAAVSFSGSGFKGTAILAFPEDSYLGVMSRFIGRTAEGRNWENQGGAAEILNIVMGKLKSRLNSPGFEIQAAIPSTLHGKQVASLPSFQGKSVILPFRCEAGAFYLEYLLTPTK